MPNKGENGVHASASPFEGLAEKSNWLGVKVEDDPFGKALLNSGVPESKLLAWLKDPQVKVDASTNGSIFDELEDLDAEDCLLKLFELHKINS